MLSQFFIRRPIFATVLSAVITLAGALTVFFLPIAQYPDITPPTVEVTASYPGANAQLVLDTVAAPIEQQVNGVENMLYMSSQCTNDGKYTLTATFQLGTDLNVAQVLVQNRVQLAMPVIPSIVQQEGVAVKKKSPNIMMIVNLVSKKDAQGKYLSDDLLLSNYATIQIKDELLRLPGVGDVTFLGQRDYSMRAWLDPEKLASRNMTASDVVNALNEQNIQVAAGQVGQQPVPDGQNFQLTMSTLGRLIEPEQFGEIILKTAEGPERAGSGHRPAARRGPDRTRRRSSTTSRARSTPSRRWRCRSTSFPAPTPCKPPRPFTERCAELEERFPVGLEYKIVYDTTPFIYESVWEVMKTLRDAILLVAIVVLVFLQNWRATLIPLTAVPVAIVGTFAVMAAMGFSLNNLSLFGLVLAIGIVVDDAIVVVENVERWLAAGLLPGRPRSRPCDEVTGPVVAVALVLCAVFVPCAFITGITGQFFRQFALTIAVSTVISAFNSLTLSPALAALLLKPHGAKRDPVDLLLDRSLGWFFRLFNWGFTLSTNAYTRTVGLLLRTSAIALVVYGGPALPDLFWLHARSRRLHPGAGQGLSDRQYAAAGRGLGATDPGGHAADRTRSPARRPAWRTPWPSRVSRCCWGPTPELRLDVRDARRVRRRGTAPQGRATPSSPPSASDSTTRCKRPWSRSSAPRRSMAWATPAASSSSSRTAATWA